MRIALGVEYLGSDFYGWQAQKTSEKGLSHTVQQVLEGALSRIADQPIDTFCAGRTDRGVHAVGQVVHFDAPVSRPLEAWIRGTNTHLPATVAVQWAVAVDETFHARFTALSRRYRYFIFNHPRRSALFHHCATWHARPLNVQAMSDASSYLLGEQDFSSFQSAECQSKTPMRNVMACTVTQRNHFIICDIEANAFLHHMVRNIVGTLIPIGEGVKEPLWLQSVLKARDRRLAGITAPPEGLTLFSVKYPECYDFPSSRYCFMV